MGDVRAAAALLAARPPHDGVPYERYTQEHWQLIDAKLPGFVPQWLRELLMDVRIAGACAELPVPSEYPRPVDQFVLTRPSSALIFVYHPEYAWHLAELHKHGFACLGDGGYGYCWAIRNDGSTDPEVYFVERSGWDPIPSEPTRGMLFPRMTVSDLLTQVAHWKPATRPAR